MEKKYIIMKMQKTSNRLLKKHIPLLPRIIFLFSRLLCGCSIPPSVEIGDNTRFAHNALGVVVHDKCVIGKNTIIQANVVLGGKDGKAPIIGDNVQIGAGAVVLGGITVGDNSIIGANAVVTKDVPMNCMALGVPAKITELHNVEQNK